MANLKFVLCWPFIYILLFNFFTKLSKERNLDNRNLAFVAFMDQYLIKSKLSKCQFLLEA